MEQVINLTLDVSMALCSMVLLHIYLSTFLSSNRGLVSLIGWLLFVVLQIMVNVDSETLNPGWNLILTLGSAILAGICCYKGKWWKRLTFSVAFVAIWMVTEALLLFCVGYFSDWNEISMQANTLYMVLSETFMAFVVCSIHQFIKKKGIGNQIDAAEIMPITILPFAAIGLNYALYQLGMGLGTEHEDLLVWLIASAFMLMILNMMLYPSYGKWVDALRMRWNHRIHVQQIELYRKHMEQDATASTEIRKIKHDIKQDLIYLKGLAAQNETTKLIAAIDDMIGNVKTNGRMAKLTGNISVDAQINQLYLECDAQKITTHVDIKIPNKMKIQDQDLSVLLGNAFDNAVEASVLVKEIPPEIWVEIFFEKGLLIITVENVFDGNIVRDASGKIKSRKGNSHGIGTQSMTQIAEKYQGSLKTSEDDRIFTLEVILHA